MNVRFLFPCPQQLIISLSYTNTAVARMDPVSTGIYDDVPTAVGTTKITFALVSNPSIKVTNTTTVTKPSTLKVTLDPFPDVYRWGPCNVTFSGTLDYDPGVVITDLSIFLSNKTTNVLSNISFSGKTWSIIQGIPSGYYQFIAKVTTNTGDIAWSDVRTIIISPTAGYLFMTTGEIYKQTASSLLNWVFDQNIGSGSCAVIYKNTIIKHQNDDGKIRYQPLAGGSWIVDSEIKTGLIAMNAINDILYGMFNDGKRYTKNLSVINSPWTLIDDTSYLQFSSAACDGKTDFAITLNGELWTRSVLVKNSSFVKKENITYDGIQLKNITALFVTDIDLLFFCTDDNIVYGRRKAYTEWTKQSRALTASGTITSISTN